MRRANGFALSTVLAAAIVLALLSGASLSVAQGTTGIGVTIAASEVSVQDYLDRVGRTLAAPRFEGRGTGTAGLDLAAEFLADEMRTIGLLPGGDDGGYFQDIEVTTGVDVGAPSWIEIGGERFQAGVDFQPIGFSTNGTLTAAVVFAGYGITAQGFGYDDYAKVDVRNKLVLVFRHEPSEMDTASRFDGDVNTAHAELRTKAIAAREAGALGLLVVNGPIHHGGEVLPAPRTDGAGYMTSGLLSGRVSERVAERIIRSTGSNLKTLQTAIDAHHAPHSMALEDSVTVTVTIKRRRASVRNVVGWIRGQDTTRTLVVGAHYDHLGLGSEGSLDPDSESAHLGADDNASGTAVLLALARAYAAAVLVDATPLHNLVFCAFTGEEMGLVGSSHFVMDPTRPLETIEAMINMDMVGRLRDERLMVMGAGTAAEFPALLARTNEGIGFDLKTSSDGYGPSDHSSFYKREVPVLALFTGAHGDYHKPSDTWDKINLAGLEKVTRFASRLIDELDRGDRVAYQVAAADSNMGRIRGGGGFGAALGSIPDYMQTEGGVLLSGVREGGPADQAGIQGGDVVIRFDGINIDNIYDYTYALRSRKPGQEVRITVRREGKEVELTATLGQSRRRGR